MDVLVARLESVTARLESIVTSKSVVNDPVIADQSDDTFTQSIGQSLSVFMSKSQELDGPIAQVADLVKQAFDALNDLISAASKSPKLSGTELQSILAPLQGVMLKISNLRDSNRSSPYFSQLSVVSEGIPALGWVVVEPAPSPFIGEMKEAGQFYANRVIKEYKEKDKRYVEWASSFLMILTDLQAYVKQHHTTGLVWQKASLSKPAAAPIKPVTASNPVSGGLLKELSTGTAGLRKVDKSEMTHKNPELRASSVVKEVPSVEKKSVAPPSQASIKAPKLALEGNKWVVENYSNESSLVIDKTEIRHTVYIYNCVNCTVMIKGKVNAVSIDACKKTGVLIENVVSTIDVVNGKSISVQITGKAPTMAVDKTDGIQIYLSKDALDIEVLSAKSSSINFMVPTPDGDYTEIAAPEQIKIQFASGAQKLICSAVEHK